MMSVTLNEITDSLYWLKGGEINETDSLE
jgi:hypothetical protein